MAVNPATHGAASLRATRDSALLVPVPEAAPVVRAHRLRLDPNAAAGVPEHITLISPFLGPEQLDACVRERLAALFARALPFPFELTSVRWFGEQVMWLAPEPAEPFVELTRLLVAEFGIPPYEGAYSEIIPHLSVALGNPQGARQVAGAIAGRLPIGAIAERVYLMVGAESTGWDLLDEYPLGD
jgi:2'-5' RNA ligase